MMMTQFIALGFLLVFVLTHPYKRRSDHVMQTFCMILPIVSMTYGFAGGMEQATEQSMGGDSGNKGRSYDSWAILFLHILVVAAPVILALYTVLSSLALWVQARRTRATRKGVQFAQRVVPVAAGADGVIEEGNREEDAADETPARASLTTAGSYKTHHASDEDQLEEEHDSKDSWTSWSSFSNPKKRKKKAIEAEAKQSGAFKDEAATGEKLAAQAKEIEKLKAAISEGGSMSREKQKRTKKKRRRSTSSHRRRHKVSQTTALKRVSTLQQINEGASSPRNKQQKKKGKRKRSKQYGYPRPSNKGHTGRRQSLVDRMEEYKQRQKRRLTATASLGPTSVLVDRGRTSSRVRVSLRTVAENDEEVGR